MPAAPAPLFQAVVYCADHRAFLCTKAVAPGLTLFTAPPSASKATPPTPPDAPCTFCSAAMPASSVAMPEPLSGVVKKSDLVNCGTRDSLPPLAYQGRWQAW